MKRAPRTAMLLAPLAVLSASFALIAASPEARGDKLCKRCELRPVIWTWKANGYALAREPEAALARARERAESDACQAANDHLAARKLACPSGCVASGAVEQSCEITGKPKCMSGTYEQSKGMWQHACAKVHQHLRDQQPCDDEHVKATPAWAMCDVSVTAQRTLACVDPTCDN